MTRILDSLSETHTYIQTLQQKNKTIGFIPTMGSLHEGHLSLVKKSLKENEITIVSIFVNPAQFGPNEDYDLYPRSFKTDSILLSSIGVSALFIPTVDMIYPDGIKIATQITIPTLTKLYCGHSRPQFFNGILTVVLRLFNIIQPTIAYFGEKDFQQVSLIRKLVSDLFLSITIKSCPIIREKNGLAMSSRNAYLSKQQIEEASSIIEALTKAKKHFSTVSPLAVDLKTIILKHITQNSKITIDYCEIIDSHTLLSKKRTVEKKDRILFAGYLGNTRLIDNIEL
jgi:pantoate--beta-alanine ligase